LDVFLMFLIFPVAPLTAWLLKAAMAELLAQEAEPRAALCRNEARRP